MFAKVVSAFVAGLAVVSAYTQPVGPVPIGNPTSQPALGQQVPVGQPFQITWTPTAPLSSPISILLLRGPSNNVVPIGVIADTVANTGSFTWTPSTSLDNDVTGYGIQIIVEGSGQYQYSPQFGISNPSRIVSVSSGSSSASSVSSASSASSRASSSSAIITSSGNSTASRTSSIILSTSSARSNSTVLVPTVTGLTTLVSPTASRNITVATRNAAARFAGSFGGAVLAAAAAVAAF